MTLKQSLIAILIGFSSVGSTCAANPSIKKITGFIDMSTVWIKPEKGGNLTDSGFDQFELDLLFDLGSGISAQVDMEYQDDGEGEEFDIEQAFINVKFNNSVSVKGGRFLSYSGWETEDPTGLYQFSGTGYAKYFYGGYQQGISAYYDGNKIDAAISAVTALGDLKGRARNPEDSWAFEVMLALNPIEAWTVKGFYMVDKLEGSHEDTQLINTWTSYIVNNWTFAIEYNQSENAPAAVEFAGIGADAEGYLLMANYTWDKAGVTFRYNESKVETEIGATVEDLRAFTIAPNYKISDNILVILEYRKDENNLNNESTNTYALEVLLTF